MVAPKGVSIPVVAEEGVSIPMVAPKRGPHPSGGPSQPLHPHGGPKEGGPIPTVTPRGIPSPSTFHPQQYQDPSLQPGPIPAPPHIPLSSIPFAPSHPYPHPHAPPRLC